MQQRETPILIDNPVHIGAVVDQELGHPEADAGVLEADGLVGEAVHNCRQRGLVEGVRFIYFCVGQDQQPDNLVVAPHASDHKRSLPIISSFQININLAILEQKPTNFLQPYITFYVPK